MKQTRDKSCGKTDRQPGAWISQLYLLLALVMLVLTLKTCVPAGGRRAGPAFRRRAADEDRAGVRSPDGAAAGGRAGAGGPVRLV